MRATALLIFMHDKLTCSSCAEHTHAENIEFARTYHRTKQANARVAKLNRRLHAHRSSGGGSRLASGRQTAGSEKKNSRRKSSRMALVKRQKCLEVTRT